MGRSGRLERAVEESRIATHPKNQFRPLLCLGAAALIAAVGLLYLTATNTPIEEVPGRITNAITGPLTRKQYVVPPQETALTTPAPIYGIENIPAPIQGIENIMNREQLKATLEEILAINRPLTNEDRDVWKKVEEANKLIYFMLTGRTFEQDKFVTRIVTREEQVPDVHPNLRNPDGSIGVAGTVAKGPNGIIYIYSVGTPNITSGASRDLVFLLANETGQAYDDRLLPINAEVWKVILPEKRLSAYEGELYREATKFVYQAAVLHLIEELGVKEITIADTLQNKEQARKGVQSKSVEGDPIKDGEVFAWWYALNNPETRLELEKNGRLSSTTALKLHQKMINDAFNPELKSMIQTATSLETKTALQPQILQLVYTRLRSDGYVHNLMPGDEIFVP